MKSDPAMLAVSPKALKGVLTSQYGQNSVIELEVEGGEKITAMVREYAYHPVSRELLHAEIETCCRDVKGYERIKAFALVEEDFTTDNGMLTPTLKLKRRVVLARYGELLERLY